MFYNAFVNILFMGWDNVDKDKIVAELSSLPKDKLALVQEYVTSLKAEHNQEPCLELPAEAP